MSAALQTETRARPPSAAPRLRRRLDPRLPAIENVARVIGAGATARLISTFGGARLYIARRRRTDNSVARLIGADAADLLAEVFGGERLCLPNDAGHASRRRIALMRKRGLSVPRIARDLRLSERYVYKVLAALRDA